MTSLVIDASVAVKWVVTEGGTEAALGLLRSAKLMAPELLTAECANILCKKAARGELNRDEAILAARILQRAEIELCPMRHLAGEATKLAIDLRHPAYDCVYLALAMERGCQFVTADTRLVRTISEGGRGSLRDVVVALADVR